MASEIETTERGGFAPVLYETPHNPTPKFETFPNPNGDGVVYAIKIGPDQWDTRRFYGPTETTARHLFTSISGFVGWLKRWAVVPEVAQVFANLPRTVFSVDENALVRRLEARIDPRDDGGDVVHCDVALDPTFEAWAELEGRGALTQLEFFAFLRGFGGVIVGAAERANLFAALAALRVTNDTTLEAEVAENGRLKVSGTRGEYQVAQEIPGEFELAVPIYQGVGEYSYSVRVLLDVQAGPQYPSGLAIRVSLPGIARTIANANDDVSEWVQEELGGDFLVCAGADRVAVVPQDSTRTSDPGGA